MARTRRTFLAATAALVAAPLAVHAQPAARVRRIGVLGSSTSDANVDQWVRENLGAALRRAGYVAGRNIDIDWRLSVPLGAPLDDAAAALVRREVELIAVFGNNELLAARRATTKLPIVMMFAYAPVELGVARSLARPGGNVTGTIWSGPEVIAKTLELLKQAKPGLSRIAVLRNRAGPGNSEYASAFERAAATLGLQPEFFEITRPDEVRPALDRIAARPPDALAVAIDTTYTGEQAGPFAIRHKLVSIGALNSFTMFQGGLFSYAPDPYAIVQRTASYIDRILRGASPADLPVELPARFLFIVNAKTARTIGYTVPQSLLLRADQVIE